MNMILALALLTSVQDPSWSSWRGPGQKGGADTGPAPVAFGPEKNIAWTLELPGKGCSTPIVQKDRIVLTAPAGGKDAVLGISLDGKLLWTTKLGKAIKGKHRNGSAANPSAATDGRFVFASFKSGTLAGLELQTGELLWQTNLQKRFGKTSLLWDQGTSPAVTKQHVVMAVMHRGDSCLAAFDKETGKPAWRAPRNYPTGTEVEESYTTPIVYDRGGKEGILVWGAAHLTAHDAADGTLLWSCRIFDPEGRGNWVVVGSPVITGSMACVSYGRGERLQAVKLGGRGRVSPAWDREGVGAFVPSLAVYRGRVYVLNDRGGVACVDPKSGKTLWEGSLPKAKDKYYASPLLTDGKLYAVREDGVVMVASIAGGALELLAQNRMGERIIASPVPLAGRLLLRGEKRLFCVQGS